MDGCFVISYLLCSQVVSTTSECSLCVQESLVFISYVDDILRNKHSDLIDVGSMI